MMQPSSGASEPSTYVCTYVHTDELGVEQLGVEYDWTMYIVACVWDTSTSFYIAEHVGFCCFLVHFLGIRMYVTARDIHARTVKMYTLME